MMDFFRQALESDMTRPELPPEDDLMMSLMERYFPTHLGGAETHEISLEERADGKAGTEAEHTIYARLTDFAQLQKASSMEHHEQWEIRVDKSEDNFGKGSFRVRKTWIDGGAPEYVRVTKVATPVDGKKIELPMPSNEEEFTVFKFLATAGMIKDRYHFPIVGTDLVWEVDCYPDGKGGYYEWVKIDLEVPDLEAPLPEFPVALDDVILPKRFKKITEEEWESLVSKLYDECFITKNQFVTGVIQEQIAKREDEATIHTGTEGEGTTPQAGEPQQTEQPAPEGTTEEEEGDDNQPETPPEQQPEEETQQA